MDDTQSEHGPLMGEADETGYRRPLGGRGGARFSTNPPNPSASGVPIDDEATIGALSGSMDRTSLRSQRLLGDWPLAVKSILSFWLFYFSLTATRVAITQTPGQVEMTKRRLLVIAVACLVSFLVYIVLRLFRRSRIRDKLIVAALVTLPAAVLLAWFNHYIFYIFGPVTAPWASIGMNEMADWPMVKLLAYESHGWYFFTAAWVALYMALSSARDLREADQRAAAFAQEAQEAQLRALRYQINPHFLFNTLNSLSSLVLANRTESAERMLMNLSAFFRTTLAADPTADVPLAEEIRLQQLYLEIEQVRFPDRLRVEIDVPEALARRRVPVLILQPIVENSVKYGVARSQRPVTIRIEAWEERERLHIVVRDDGENPSSEIPPESTGVGLRNVTERLRSRFGDDAGFTYGIGEDGGFIALLQFPALDAGHG